jgi:acyl carrier protein
MNDISTIVYRIISETLGTPLSELRPDLAIRSIPNVESIKILNVILKVENVLEIEIPDEATFNLETVGQFDQLVQDLYTQRPEVTSR